MPCLTVVLDRVEIARLTLEKPLVIGRSRWCDLPVADLLLSRQHCRFEPRNGRWVVVDLGSRNGVRFRGQLVPEHLLADGDILQLGRCVVRYLEHVFDREASASTSLPVVRSRRPLHPLEQQAATVFGIVHGSATCSDDTWARLSGSPRPLPRATEPRSYRDPAVFAMIRDLSLVEWEHPSTPLPWDATTRPVETWTTPADDRTRVHTARGRRWRRLVSTFGTAGVLLAAAWWLLHQAPRG
jgi:hypothetical protein